MRRSILALMDSEPGYAVRFMEYVNRKRFTHFDVHAFTEKEALRLYMAEHRVEVLLIAEQDFGEEDEWPVSRVVLLAAGKKEGSLRYPAVCKYQSAVEVMREVGRICGRPSSEEELSEETPRFLKMPARVIGVFSPVGRCRKTSFSLAASVLLAASRPTLYLNLEACAGLSVLLGAAREATLADLIFYIREGDRNLGERIPPLVRQEGALAILPPPADSRELYTVSEKEWRVLFEGLRRDSSYEYVVADLGDVPFCCPGILDECDLIYMPEVQDRMGAAKLAEYTGRLVGRSEESDTAERIRRISLTDADGPDPFARAEGSAGAYLESLAYGEFGRIVRDILKRDGMPGN